MRPFINKKYPFQVWLGTITIAPLIIGISLIITSSAGYTAIGGMAWFFIYSVFFGAVLSLPTLFIFFLAFKDFVHFRLSSTVIKLLLGLVAILGLGATLYFLGFYNELKDFNDIVFLIAYLVAIIFSSLIFQLKKTK